MFPELDQEEQLQDPPAQVVAGDESLHRGHFLEVHGKCSQAEGPVATGLQDRFKSVWREQVRALVSCDPIDDGHPGNVLGLLKDGK